MLWSSGWSLGLFCFPGSNAGVLCCLMIFGALGNEYFLLKCTKCVSPLSAVIKCITFFKNAEASYLFLDIVPCREPSMSS